MLTLVNMPESKRDRPSKNLHIFIERGKNSKAYGDISWEENIWDVIVDPARKVRIGNRIYFNDKLWCEVIDNTTSRGRTVRINYEGDAIYKAIEKIGQTPLPPYIKRNTEKSDREDYQTKTGFRP